MSADREDGDCFEVAALIVCDIPSDIDGVNVARKMIDEINPTFVKLAHGFVSRPDDGFRHAHGWVELWMNGALFVLDHSNNKRFFGFATRYYSAGNIKDDECWKYTPDAARHAMIREETYGPWEGQENYMPKESAIAG